MNFNRWRIIKLINQEHIDIFQGIVGDKVFRVKYLTHYFEGLKPGVIAVQIGFLGYADIVIKCDSDGESLKAINGALEEIDLGEFGKIEVVDSIDFDPASLHSCIDKRLIHVVLEISNDKLKAVNMQYEGKRAFFANIGDALNFDEACFRKMVAEESWATFTKISYPLDFFGN